MARMTDLTILLRGLAGLRATEPPRLVAVGWATVDLERTLDDLGIDPGPVVDEPLLGGRATRIDLGGIALLVLEPTTEGRLAAALARRGEGICALYLATGGSLGPGARVTGMGVPGRLLPHDQPWGPFVIEVAGR
jgi:hypothetical protein